MLDLLSCVYYFRDADRKKTRQFLNELQGQEHEAKMETRTKKK